MNGLCALKLKQLADFFQVGCDVLVDPDMIKAHRGFTGKLDWVDQELSRGAYREEFIKENTLTQVGSDGSVIDAPINKEKLCQ